MSSGGWGEERKESVVTRKDGTSQFELEQKDHVAHMTLRKGPLPSRLTCQNDSLFSS